MVTVTGGWVNPAQSEVISDYTVMGLPAAYEGTTYLAQSLARCIPRKFRETGDDRIEIKDNHTRLLTRKPNRYASAIATLETWFGHYFLYRNGYLACDLIRGELINLNPANVIPFKMNGEKLYYLQKQNHILAGNEVLHLMGRSHNGLVGIDPIELHYGTWQKSQKIQEFSVEYFDSKAHITGIIQTPASLTKEQLEAMKSAFMDRYTGKVGGVPILPFGSTWQSVNPSSNEQAQLIELQKKSDADIRAIFGVPETRDTQSVLNAIDIARQKAEHELLKLLTPEQLDGGEYFRLDTGPIRRNDLAWRQQMGADVDRGTMLVKEYRGDLDLPRIAGDDIPRINVSQSQTIAPGQPGSQLPAPAVRTNAPAASTAPAPSASYSAVMHPLIEAAAERVTSKANKAFERHHGRSDYRQWKTEFSKVQADDIRQAFTPVVKAYEALTGNAPDIERLAEAYSKAMEQTGADELFIFNLGEKARGIFK